MALTKTQQSLDNVFNVDSFIPVPVKEEAKQETIENDEIVPTSDKSILPVVDFDQHGEMIPVDKFEDEDNDIKEAIQDDYEIARSNLKELLNKGSGVLDLAIQLAEGTENPKSVDSVIKMIGQLADVNMKLMETTSRKQDVFVKTRPKVNSKFNEYMDGTLQPNITNNTMFVGSTNDLINLLKKKNEEENNQNEHELTKTN